MKILAGIALFVLLGVGVNGQVAVGSKVAAETAVLSEKIVKGSPFSAEAVNESVQVLADGNRIVHTSTNKLYRNSEGRFRREISGGSGGSLSSFYTVGPGITILDPIVGQRYLLDEQLKTARVNALSGKLNIVTEVDGVAKASPVAVAQAALVNKIRAEEAAAELAGGESRALAPAAVVNGTLARAYGETITTLRAAGVAPTAFSSIPATKYETRTEELGAQTVEGVDAVGTRTITTIPAGAIGNELPIDVVYEKWFSNDLQLVVMSKHTDPRFGEQTYRLTNIVRNEPDPSLFEVPMGYKMVTEPSGTYTITGKGTSGTYVTSKDSSGGYVITGKGGGQNVIYTKTPAPATKTTKP